LLPPITQQQNSKTARQETESLLDLLFHRTPTTKISANRTSVAAAQTPSSSSKAQSENAASPQSQQGTAASLPAPNSSSAANPGPSASAAPALPSTPNTAATAQQSTAAIPAATTPPQSAAEIPAADLATLYNYVQDCRACQLELTTAKQNASDDAAKIHALTRERDAAVTAAKGGPIWLRLKRNAHYLALGAAIGAVTSAAALCHTGHCR
jgi:hypothetical protein